MRMGIFGGTFDPLHSGHINCIMSAKQRLSLDQVAVVLAAQNPRKSPIEGASIENRLEMLKIGLAPLSDYVKIDEQEVTRGGLSYTVETVENYAKTVSPENLFVIIGMDQLDQFDKWKDFEKILTMANLAVITRPGHNMPYETEDLPSGLQSMVSEFEKSFIALKTGQHIEFIRLQEDVSASEIRKSLRMGRGVEKYLTAEVERYIREHKLYAPIGPKIGDYEDFTRFCADLLFEKKGVAIKGYDLREMDAPSEFTLIASGTSTRHASSLADFVIREVKAEFNVFPQSIEGAQEGRWVLIDYGSLIVHIFYDFVRQEYRLEELWKRGKDLKVVDRIKV